MDELNAIIDIAINLIRVGAIMRLVYLAIATIIETEQKDYNFKKGRNIIIAYIFAETVVTIKSIILHYYS